MLHIKISTISTMVMLAIVILHQYTPIEAKIYSKCAMARVLLRNGIPYSELSDWLCLIEGESSFNTKAINYSNDDGSTDWGLFQINDRYWCKPSGNRPSSDSCHMPCRLLMSDDIRYSIGCAKYIRKVQGFSAWVAWNNRCQGIKQNVGYCFKRKLPYAE